MYGVYLCTLLYFDAVLHSLKMHIKSFNARNNLFKTNKERYDGNTKVENTRTPT
jgi:hypothetical protein